MVEKTLSDSVITGADGMLGCYFDFGFKTDKDTLDITNEKKIREVLKAKKPKYVFHLAALTDLELCERHRELALQINFFGTKKLAQVCREIGAKMIYISTAAVFGGKKRHKTDEAPQPKSFYAITKYLGEIAVQSILEDYLIIRTSWLFGGGPKKDKKFVSKILRQIEEGLKIKAVGDLYGCPTYCKDLVFGIEELIKDEKRGIFHIVNKGEASRYEIAREIIKIIGEKVEIEKVSNKKFSSKVFRDHEMLESSLSLRPWQEALKEYVESEWLQRKQG